MAVYEDEFVKVTDLGFDPTPSRSGEKLRIAEKQAGVGLYNICVTFNSGNFAQIQYDGATAGGIKEFLATTHSKTIP
jgi:hypothetical protein